LYELQLQLLSSYQAAPLEELSFKYLHVYQEPKGEHKYVGGYDRIVGHVMNQLKEKHEKKVKVKLLHEVNKIARLEKGKVTISGKKIQEKEEKFEEQFDIVIVSVPLGVLKSDLIEFVPALPEKKVTAIKRMGMGVANKVILQFKSSFWREVETRPAEWINYSSDKPGVCPFFYECSILL